MNKKNHVTYNCNYHIIFCPKYRKKLLRDDVKTDLIKILKDKSSELDSKIIQYEIMSDHVHLLVEIPPQISIGTYIKRIKGTSSKILREKYPELKSKLPALWTHSYFVSTTGGVNLEKVKEYIENQETQYEARLKYQKNKKEK